MSKEVPFISKEEFKQKLVAQKPRTEPMTWLEMAAQVTKQDRQVKYGSPLINFVRIAVDWTIKLQEKMKPGEIVTPREVAWLMVGLKSMREVHSFQVDNGVDTIGYMACVDSMDRALKELGYDNGIEVLDEANFAALCDLLERLAQS